MDCGKFHVTRDVTFLLSTNRSECQQQSYRLNHCTCIEQNKQKYQGDFQTSSPCYIMIQQIEDMMRQKVISPPRLQITIVLAYVNCPTYHIWQSFQGGKLSQLERKIVIHGKTFMVVQLLILTKLMSSDGHTFRAI